MSSKDKRIAGYSVSVLVLVTTAVVLFMAFGQQRGPRSQPGAASAKSLRRAQSWEDLRQRLADQLADWIVSQHRRVDEARDMPPRPMRSADAMSADSDPRIKQFAPSSRAEAAKQRAAGPSHHTGTNNQVAGVEEADIVQTDGRRIYTIHGRELLIIRSWPAHETAIIARYWLPAQARPRELLVNTNRLVILSDAYGSPSFPRTSGMTRPGFVRQRRHWHRPNSAGRTRITVLDISRPAQPTLAKEIELDGRLTQSRMIGRRLFVISAAAMRLPDPVVRAAASWVSEEQVPDGGGGVRLASEATARARLSAQIYRAIGRDDIKRLLPRAWVRTSASQGQLRMLHQPSDIYIPTTGGQPGMLSLTRIDLDGSDLQSTGILAHGSTVYAAHQAIYVARTSRSWDREGSFQQTQIHQFGLGEQGGPRYLASGTVPGALLNQFSMDEHKGHLRVATTERTRWRWRGRGWGRTGRSVPEGGNNLFVLRPREGELAVVGEIRGLAKGERIYSARFLGDEGYIVTFRQTDPLFTLDLSVPERPRVMGELKVNGFSSYIHPLGKRTLLTIGQDATSGGRVTGVHLQIFDVSDLTNPRRTHHHRVNVGQGNSHSAAQLNHHAFTFDPTSGVLAFPIRIADYRDRSNNFVGLMIFAVDQWAGLREIGRVDHGDLGLRRPGEPCMLDAMGHCLPRRRRVGANAPKMRRSLIIDGYIYSLSTVGLKVNRIFAPESTVASVVFSD